MASGSPSIRSIPFIDPMDAARQLAGRSRLCFLDSAMVGPTLGRWSYLAADPIGVFTVVDGVAYWQGEARPGAPMEVLRGLLSAHAIERDPSGPPFQGGAIGYVAYEAGHLFESIPTVGRGPVTQVDLAFFTDLIAFDVVEQRAYAIGSGVDPLVAQLATGRPVTGTAGDATIVSWHDSRTRAQFEAEVATVIDHIRAGDIFQANIAHRFTGRPRSVPDPVETYAALRQANPAPFAALLIDGDCFVASTSPERFVRVTGRQVETRPIKGTRRRSADPASDARIADELAASDKDRAENTMIVDLLRNDFSRVCEPDSVHVPTLCGVESYASVHHLVSVVTGRLRAGADVVDLISATFPGGSITGAPKIEAMKVISAIEQDPRGVYCGSIGWIGFDGDADLNIAIRTLVFDGRDFTLHAGGGITLLSDPALEYDETLAKAERILSVFKTSS